MRQLDPPFSKDNLDKVLFKASPEEWHDGMVWYQNAHEWCMCYNTYSVDQVAAIVAVFSRNTSWNLNLVFANRYLNGQPFGHFKKCMAQAEAVLSGKRPLDVLTGWKIRAFYQNIADPSRDDIVTIDRHAAALLAGMKTPRYIKQFKNAAENPHLHRKATEIYNRAAKERGILANQAQAISWLVHRGQD